VFFFSFTLQRKSFVIFEKYIFSLVFYWKHNFFCLLRKSKINFSPLRYLFIDKLKSENSKVLDNWPSLISKLQLERDLAQENAEYLSTLQEYFIVSINQPWLFFLLSSRWNFCASLFINRLEYMTEVLCFKKGRKCNIDWNLSKLGTLKINWKFLKFG
jgi:hypothetical protein